MASDTVQQSNSISWDDQFREVNTRYVRLNICDVLLSRNVNSRQYNLKKKKIILNSVFLLMLRKIKLT